MQRKSYRRPRPSFAPYVNIKVYYFSISISDRTRNFLIYTRGRTAAAVKPRPGVVPQRYRAGCRNEGGEGERKRSGRIRSSRVTNEADTHLCPAFSSPLFFLPSLVSAASLISSSLRRSLSVVRLSRRSDGGHVRKMLLKFIARSLHAPVRLNRTGLSSGMRSSSRRTEFPAIGTAFLLHAIYDGSRARWFFACHSRECGACMAQSSGSMGRVVMR